MNVRQRIGTKMARFAGRMPATMLLLSGVLRATSVWADSAPSVPETPVAPTAAHTITVEAEPLFDTPQVVDRIEIRQVLHLTSSEPRFGGFSGMVLTPDGNTLVAVSDRGDWLRLGLSYAPDGRVSSVHTASMAPILTPEGQPVEGRMETDAEAMLIVDDGLVVAFEGGHRLWHYACPDGDLACRPTPARAPRAIRHADDNHGFEAVAALADGRLFILAEELFDRRGRLRGWVSSRMSRNSRLQKPSWRGITLPAAGAFRPTSVVGIPNGDVILVERSFSPEVGVRIRISRLDGKTIRPGRTLERDVLAHFDESLPIDNLEASHVVVDADGAVTLFIISDNNFSDRQRTLLLEIGLPRFD